MKKLISVPVMNRLLLEGLLSKRVEGGELLDRVTVHENTEYTIEKIVFKMKEVIYECLKIDGGMVEYIFTETQEIGVFEKVS